MENRRRADAVDLTIMTIAIRTPESIYRAEGNIEKGTFHGRWHFSFGEYFDSEFINFGTLRVFNDDTLSSGAIWPLHPHKEIEVVTYCVKGEFRHADDRGGDGVLKKGWVQHTTIGRGMWHSEINNLKNMPLRFIQMWFRPSYPDLPSTVEQMKCDISDRTNKFLPLVSNDHPGALPIPSEARVFSCFLQGGYKVSLSLKAGWGAYLYLIEGGSVEANNHIVSLYGAAMIKDQDFVDIVAKRDAELILAEVML